MPAAGYRRHLARRAAVHRAGADPGQGAGQPGAGCLESQGVCDRQQSPAPGLLWDPDRRRLLRAEQALLAAPGWLKKFILARAAAKPWKILSPTWNSKAATCAIRSAQPPWLDMILEGCKKLRRGTWPTELIASSPAFLREMPWLKKFDRADPSPDIQTGR
jgi:hypothetical protein